MSHGRESKAIALRAARASIEANITVLELAAGLIADGWATPRARASVRIEDATAAIERPAGRLATVRAIG